MFHFFKKMILYLRATTMSLLLFMQDISLHCQKLNSNEINKSTKKHSKIHHPLYQPSNICVDNQLLIITGVFITIRHKSILITLKL